MAQQNAINNRSSTLTVDNALTVTAGGASITGTSTIDGNNAAVTIKSGTGQLDIAADAAAGTVNIATGAGAKVVQLGSTNGASSLALKYGTADFTIASVTGTTMSILDTGEMTMPLQSAFLAYLGSNDLNKTGNGTFFVIGSATALTEVFDQNSDFNTNGTFTAPVTGRYQLNANVGVTGCTIAVSSALRIVTSNRTYYTAFNRAASNLDMFHKMSHLCDMDAGDTAVIDISSSGEAADTDDIYGSATLITAFSGYLAC